MQGGINPPQPVAVRYQRRLTGIASCRPVHAAREFERAPPIFGAIVVPVPGRVTARREAPARYRHAMPRPRLSPETGVTKVLLFHPATMCRVPAQSMNRYSGTNISRRRPCFSAASPSSPFARVQPPQPTSKAHGRLGVTEPGDRSPVGRIIDPPGQMAEQPENDADFGPEYSPRESGPCRRARTAPGVHPAAPVKTPSPGILPPQPDCRVPATRWAQYNAPGHHCTHQYSP